MAKQLQKSFSTLDLIAQGRTINSWHVSQVVDAFTGVEEFDISILGTLSVDGKLFLNLPNIPPVFTNNVQLKYLALNPSNNQVYTTTSTAAIYPIELNPLTKTAWNSGRGNLNNNTNFGYSSFIRNTTGDNNTIYGSNNAINNLTGNGITVVGTRNVNAGTNLNNVIAIGNQVLFNAEVGDNIGAGLKTLYNLKFGTNNVGIGNFALYNSIYGENNLSLGNYAASLSKGNNNITLGHSALPFDESGDNRITIGTYAGRYVGDGWLEIHSYSNSDDDSEPLILGNFISRMFKINGSFNLDLSLNPVASSLNVTPNQILFDSNGKAYVTPRGYTISEANSKFKNGNNESLTTIDQPVLSGGVLTIKYTGEDGIQQQQSVSIPSASGDKNYTHDQSTPSTVWVINHNLGKRPSTTITDTSGNVVEGHVLINNQNTVTITFNSAFSGYAELN